MVRLPFSKVFKYNAEYGPTSLFSELSELRHGDTLNF